MLERKEKKGLNLMKIQDKYEFNRHVVTIHFPKELIDFIKTNKFEFHARLGMTKQKIPMKEVIGWIEENSYNVGYELLLKRKASIIVEMLYEVSRVIAFDSKYDELVGRYNIYANINRLMRLMNHLMYTEIMWENLSPVMYFQRGEDKIYGDNEY